LLRVVLDFRSRELVVRCLYKTQDGPGPWRTGIRPSSRSAKRG